MRQKKLKLPWYPLYTCTTDCHTHDDIPSMQVTCDHLFPFQYPNSDSASLSHHLVEYPHAMLA